MPETIMQNNQPPTVMLSRVADSLFWIGRQIERAENIARMLEVNLNLMLDFEQLDDEKVKEHWEPLIRSTGDEALFCSMYDKAGSATATDFLTFNRKNPASVISCLLTARENARMVRDQISSDMWEVINELYIYLKSQSAEKVYKTGAHEFFEQIKNYSYRFQGLTDSTFSRNEGYEFLQLGKYIERADKTSRILDIKYHILLPKLNDIGGAVDVAQWQAILKSASALESYHRVYVAEILPWKVADFLIFNENFPRSIRFSLKAIDHFLHRISGTPFGQFSNEAERLSGRITSDLSFTTVDEIFRVGLHEFLDNLQVNLNNISSSVFQSYMLTPKIDMAAEIQQQQQSQTQ